MVHERILSIQSHVVFGYVGGKAAVFPLQCLGYDVDVINTVNFSNHAGYGRAGGTKTTSAELDAMFTALEDNELLLPTRLLTGYIPGAEALSAVAKIARKMKKEKPDLIYLLDPVMGDAGKMYVAPDVIPVYREMLPLATIITPNWYEVEVLTETKIQDIASLQKALHILHHKYHVPNVVISSIPLKRWLIPILPSTIEFPTPPTSGEGDSEEYLFCLSSSTQSGLIDMHTGQLDEIKEYPTLSIIHAACVPLIPGYFSGVGDLFSALLLAHFHPHLTPHSSLPSSNIGSPSPSQSATGTSTPLSSISSPSLLRVPPAASATPPPLLGLTETPLSYAASLALTKTHTILSNTHDYAAILPMEEKLPSDDELDLKDPMRKIKRMRGRELRLVQGQDVIRGIGLKREDVRWMVPWDSFWRIEAKD